MTLPRTLILGAVVRLILISYGSVQDLNFKVKYTDIDYVVFSDAAKHVLNGTSPYSRATYRYTPLLAFMMTPNIFIHSSFGKFFFAMCDLIIGWLITKINSTNINASAMVKDAVTKESSLLATNLWLFNPLSLTISTRGNAESFQAVLVLATLLCVISKQHFLGGLLFGLAVHFKIYPIIYSLPILLYMSRVTHHRLHWSWETLKRMKLLQELIKGLAMFIIPTGFVLLATTFLFYYWYQMEFIEQTYLYHLKRTDIKHNFSPYFYVLYLTHNSPWSSVIGFMAFLPQAVSVIVLGIKYHSAPAVACFLQTFAFVTFNKVCTSQYFIWYLSLLPTAMVYFKKGFYKNAPFLVFLWMSAQGIWLYLAYLLEFQGLNTFAYVWLASLWFLIINVYILLKLMSGITIPSTLTKIREIDKKVS